MHAHVFFGGDDDENDAKKDEQGGGPDAGNYELPADIGERIGESGDHNPASL